MTKYGMVFDLDRCVGCRTFMEACKVENNTGKGIFWMHVFRFEEGEYPHVRIRVMPRPCMHCENPPCVKVCPTGARYQRDDGIVATDFETCTGVRYCHAACPYGVNYFNWKEPSENYYLPNWATDADLQPVSEGAVPPYKNPDLEEAYGSEQRRIAGGGHNIWLIEKCTFCVQRVENGLKPACVTVCPTKTITFGDLDDPDSEVSRLIREKRSFRLREEFGTRPKVYYVGTAPIGTDARQIEKVGGVQ